MDEVAKRVTVFAKCSDRCQINVQREDGSELVDHQGYVKGIPNEYGDYIDFELEIRDDGLVVVTNWDHDQFNEWLQEKIKSENLSNDDDEG